MTGYLPAAWQALPAMDLFVLPSLSEGMGLVLLEAAQARIPIIASQVGGIPELFENNSEALLTNPADPLDLTLACSRILEDQNLAKNLVVNAHEKAIMYTVEKMTADTTEFYDFFIADTSSKAP
jgi:glycosyltransferase involved in cell wall biosynthesis